MLEYIIAGEPFFVTKERFPRTPSKKVIGENSVLF